MRWAGRRQSNSGATRGAAGGAGSDKQPLPARPAPLSPNAAPSREKPGGGYLGFCACRKKPQRAKDSVREPVRRLPPPTQAQPVAQVPTRPPPNRPSSAPSPTDSRPAPGGLSQGRDGPGIPVPARFHLLNRGGSDLPLASLPRGCERHRHVASVTTTGKSRAHRVNSKLGERRRPLGRNHFGNAGRGDAPVSNKQEAGLT